MKHKKILNLLMKQVILNWWQENGTLSMVNQMEIMIQEIKLSKI